MPVAIFGGGLRLIQSHTPQRQEQIEPEPERETKRSYLQERIALRNRMVGRISRECAWRRRLVLVYGIMTGDKESTTRLMLEMESELGDDIDLSLPSDLPPRWGPRPYWQLNILQRIFPHSSSEIELRLEQEKQYDSLRDIEASLFETQNKACALKLDAMELSGLLPARWKGRIPISELKERFRKIDAAGISTLDGMADELPLDPWVL